MNAGSYTPPLGIVMATGQEAKPFIRGLSLQRIDSRPCVTYSGNGVLLAVSGIGMTRAAAATEHLIATYGITTALNLGAAGSTHREARVGEIYQVDLVMEYDGTRNGLCPECFRADTIGSYPSRRLITVTRVVTAESERSLLARHGDLIDMEGMAFLRVCRERRVRAHLFKFVSDTPEHDSIPAILFWIFRTRDRFYQEVSRQVLPLFFSR
ncbi:MAG: hypothetical protein JXA20_00815 [Spirochaetes bacterium]|nr:hypothetical protein [Spirochaetota bacterium]